MNRRVYFSELDPSSLTAPVDFSRETRTWAPAHQYDVFDRLGTQRQAFSVSRATGMKRTTAHETDRSVESKEYQRVTPMGC